MGLFAGIKMLETRVVLDYAKLAKFAEVMKDLGQTIVVTIGTFDLTHVGHYRYLRKAKEQGDILIVGLDSNEAVKRYKGPTRPAWPENERMETILHTGYADFVTLIDDVDDKGEWGFALLEAVRPQIFVAVEGSYPEEQLAQIRQFCDEVMVFPRQAEQSTSESIRKTVIDQTIGAAKILRSIADALERGEPVEQLERILADAPGGEK